MATQVPIFCWEENKNNCGKVVSASHLSCELAPSTPTTFFVTLRAPYLDGIAGEAGQELQQALYVKKKLIERK